MPEVSRRQFLKSVGLTTAVGSTLAHAQSDRQAGPRSKQSTSQIQWLSTTERNPLISLSGASMRPMGEFSVLAYDADVQLNSPKQRIEGFGGTFNEQGWDALQHLSAEQQKAILSLLFSSTAGANFSVCRTPIGASDFARDWYSYAESKGDLSLRDFSVKRDESSLIPYIQAAQNHQPALQLWASPWSPPAWMKTNQHYAMTAAWPGTPDNGLLPHQQGHEGQDYFVNDPAYLRAYARYFRRYIESYREHGINTSAVMPQNEFNSAQPFPSCCWTPELLATFVTHLSDELQALGTDIYLGTYERGNPELLERFLSNAEAATAISGVGVQWDGKHALPIMHYRHPELSVWGTEQECGDGKNDWAYARYTWGLIKHYLRHGCSMYDYWNMVLDDRAMSTWGWPQNSLFTVFPDSRDFRINPEYYVMRHLSQYVKPGAEFIPSPSFVGHENQLVFRNPDQSLVIVVQNDLSESLAYRLKIGSKILHATLPADSFNTLRLPPSEYAA